MQKNILSLVLVSFVLVFVIFLISPYLIYQSAQDHIYTSEEAPKYDVAIVFGAGITELNTPTDVLKDRLTVAGRLYWAGTVEKILVSGDNSNEQYSEPDVMRDYLIEIWGIPEEDVTADYAGRRTYDTCVRAHEVWGIESALLVSQAYHLPRSIFTCSKLGMDSEGVTASLQDYVFQKQYELREILALYKAVIDVYLIEPSYIGGESEAI